MQLSDIIKAIESADPAYKIKASDRTAQLLMPSRAMGRLHDIAEQVCAITRTEKPCVDKKAVLVMAGDHGITEEGVSAYPSEITGMMVQTFINDGATVNALARQAGASVTAVDMGIVADIPENTDGVNTFICRKIVPGTANFAKGPAMTREQAEQSILTGFDIASKKISEGVDLLATGDMGIGNTTPSTAIGVVMTGNSVEEMTGRGTGVDDEGLQRKIAAVTKGLEINQPDASDALDVLAKVGGFEIGGIAGICLAAAYHKKPVIVDGIISTAGALIAHGLASVCTEYMLAGHCSFEQGHRPMLQHMGLEPLLDLGLRLGEGTGAVLAMNLVQAAANVHNEVLTFADIGM